MSAAFFRPKLFEVLRGNTLADFFADLIAGIIALSRTTALVIASERTPGIGIIIAIAAVFLVSAVGVLKVQIGGLTAAFIPSVVAWRTPAARVGWS